MSYNTGLDKFTDRVIFIFLGFVVGVFITTYYNKKDNNNLTNVETIDSIVKVNDSIKIKIEKLDSVKNAKIIEVSTLNNDSTLKLFYELVSE